MPAEEITNSRDFIDSREIISRIAELEGYDCADEDARCGLYECPTCEESGRSELDALRKLQEQCDWGDWDYGATLIRDSYFTTYAQQFAEDIGAINSDASWPATCIDWDEAARELQMDYTSVDFAGETYWVR